MPSTGAHTVKYRGYLLGYTDSIRFQHDHHTKAARKTELILKARQSSREALHSIRDTNARF